MNLWSLYQRVSRVNLMLSHLYTPLFSWILLSLISVLVFNLLSFTGKLGFSFILHRVIDTVILTGIITHIVVYRIKRPLVQALAEKIAEPFGEFPEQPEKLKIVRKFKKRVTLCGMAICGFATVGVTFECGAPLVNAILLYHSGTRVQDLPLPIGRVPWFVDSIWWFSLVYLVSATALITCSTMYVCWFSMFFSSALQIETYLKLLVLDIKQFEVKTLEFCRDKMSLVNCQKRLKDSNQSVVEEAARECLRQIVLRHINIMRHVRTLEDCYKLVILVFCKSGILITAFSATLIIDEWYYLGKLLPDRVNMFTSTLFFLYVNSYAGQILIDQSTSLRSALYNINWMDKSPGFKLDLYLMMTASRRPLRLSAGTVFTLGMESYSTIMEAVYSYVNFLIQLMQLKAASGPNMQGINSVI